LNTNAMERCFKSQILLGNRTCTEVFSGKDGVGKPIR
jgi:hypothetical protein